MSEFRLIFLNLCHACVQQVQAGELSEEEAADELVGFLSQHTELLESPDIKAIFNALGLVDIPREVSANQPIGQWNQVAADKLKTAEWQEVVIAIQNLRS